MSQRQPEHAARLFAWADAMREKMGTPIPPIQRGDYAAQAQILREKKEAAFELWHTEGRALTMDEAIALALEE